MLYRDARGTNCLVYIRRADGIHERHGRQRHRYNGNAGLQQRLAVCNAWHVGRRYGILSGEKGVRTRIYRFGQSAADRFECSLQRTASLVYDLSAHLFHAGQMDGFSFVHRGGDAGFDE